MRVVVKSRGGKGKGGWRVAPQKAVVGGASWDNTNNNDLVYRVVAPQKAAVGGASWDNKQ